MKILLEINREVRMLLSEKNLPAHGKAAAWVLVALVAAVAFAIVCFGISIANPADVQAKRGFY